MNKLHSITEVKNQPGETAIPSFVKVNLHEEFLIKTNL